MTAFADPATRELLADRARSRRQNGPTLGQRADSAYTALLAVLVLGSMVVSGSAGILDGTGCSSAVGCLDPRGRPALAAAVALAGWGLLWRATVLLGPVGSSRAEVAWLLSTPADRRTLLLPSAGRAFAAAVTCGGLLGWVVLAAADPATSVTGVLGAVLAGAAASVATVAAGVTRQPVRHGAPSPVPAWTALATAAGCAVLAMLPGVVAAPWPPPAALPPGVAPVLTVLSGLAAGLAVVLSLRRLDDLPLPELTAAGDAQEGVHGAVVMLESAYATSRLRGRRTRRGRATSRRGRGAGAVALLLRDVQLTGRRPGALVGAAGLTVVPAVALLLTGPLPAQVLAVLLGLRVARGSGSSSRTVAGSGGLARSLPFSPLVTSVVLLVVPGTVTVAWSAVVVALLGGAPWEAVALGLAALAGAVRTASPAAGQAAPGPLVMTDSGPVPLGTAGALARGPDVVLLAAAPVLLGAGPLLALLLPAALLAGLVVSSARQR